MKDDLLILYHHHLVSDKKAGKATVKNYIADVRKFIAWYETRYTMQFNPKAVGKELANAYLNGEPANTNLPASDAPSPSSVKRYASSLRKFFDFLKLLKLIDLNPFEVQQAQKLFTQDPWHKKEFNNYLFLSNISKVTRKNYAIDIKQFTAWAQEVLVGGVMPVEASVLQKVDTSLIEEYKNRLLYDAQLSPSSINRKLSSLRKYFSWATEQGFMKHELQIASEILTEKPVLVQPAPLSLQPEMTLEDLKPMEQVEPEYETAIENNYSRFGPIRFFQKSGKLITLIGRSLILVPIDKSAELIRYSSWKMSGRKVFAPVEEIIGAAAPEAVSVASSQLQAANPVTQSLMTAKVLGFLSSKLGSQRLGNVKIQGYPKSFYAPLSISVRSLPAHKRIWHHMRHTRPAWYHRYHAYQIVHYIHFGILLGVGSMLGMHVYSNIADARSAIPVIASPPESPPRTLSYTGKLNDDSNNPITAETNLRFAIYKSPTASGSAQLWEETQIVNPDFDGRFTVLLGKKAPLRQNLFTDNHSLYLGISVGNDKELQPRHPLTNVANAGNANTLQGLKPITENNALTRNVILALDSSGNLTIGGNASAAFQVTGGEFTLSGQVLSLISNPGSNGNIQIVPDGTGIVDIQKPIQNTSQYGTIPSMAGAVEIADMLAISTSTSSQSALYINQNGSGPLISAYTGETAKFILDHEGNGSFGGNISLTGNKLSSSANSFDLLTTNAININFGGSATAIGIGATSGMTTVNNNFKTKGTGTFEGILNANGGITIPAGKSLTITDMKPGAIPFISNANQMAQDNEFVWDSANKRLGIGTASPSAKLTVVGLGTGTGTALVVDDNGNFLRNSSSLRYKDDIKPLQTNTLTLLNAAPVSFRYKDTGSYDIGFIAEDFDALGLKDLVIYNKEGKPDAIKYDKLSVYLLEIVKSQQAAIKALQDAAGTIKDGYIEASHITTKALTIVSEDIMIGGQKVKEYIASVVTESNGSNTLGNSTQTTNPIPTIASGSASTDQAADNSHFQSATSSALSNTDTLYNNISSTSAEASGSAEPIITPYPTISQASISGIMTPTSPLFQPGNVMNIKYEGDTNYADIASFSAELAYVPNFKSDYATFNQGLIALGPTSLTDVGVSGNLLVGGNLHISDNSINTIGSDLNLQPLRQGSLTIMGGLVKIDPEGNLNVGGNANFAKDVTVQGKLAAGIIAPVPGSDIIVKLEEPTEEKPNSSFTVQDAKGQTVAAINQAGDIIASGEAKFNTLAGKSFKIIRGAQADTSLTETKADGSAGTGVITAYELERTITTPYVTKDSLIYVTATSNTQKVTPYIARQTENSFTVQIPQTVTKDISFNWWIVN